MNEFAEESGPVALVRGPKYTGNFTGLVLIRADAQKEPERRGRPVDQQAAEAMLPGRARSLGIEVCCGCDITNLVQQEHALMWNGCLGQA
jgi:hypothetical protein